MSYKLPNPANIPLPGDENPQYPPQLTTKAAGNIYPTHDHQAFVDEDGNGATDTDASHFHRVRNFRILPDESDGHTHDLTGLPTGQVAPHRPPPSW